jgi:hypothetical protein
MSLNSLGKRLERMLYVGALLLIFSATEMYLANVSAKIGTLYLTRQKELLCLKSAENFKDVFPHILNIFPSLHGFERPPVLTGPDADEKYRKQSIKIAATLRSLMIIMICVPMIFMFASSCFDLIHQAAGGVLEPIFLCGALVVILILSVQTFLLVSQEFIIVKEKIFHG